MLLSLLNNHSFFKIIVLVLFFLWLVPLGKFISAEEESSHCGGKRAICLCIKSFQQAALNLKGFFNDNIEVSFRAVNNHDISISQSQSIVYIQVLLFSIFPFFFLKVLPTLRWRDMLLQDFQSDIDHVPRPAC